MVKEELKGKAGYKHDGTCLQFSEEEAGILRVYVVSETFKIQRKRNSRIRLVWLLMPIIIYCGSRYALLFLKSEGS